MCDTCNVTFNSRSELKEHIGTLHQRDVRHCRQCSFVAVSEASRLAHEKAVHLNLKCKQCKQFFSCKTSMAEHKCKELKKLQCNQCGKGFNSQKELIDHTNYTHKGLKYTCNICNATLSTEKNLKRHIHSVHEILVRRFPCPLADCDKSFKDQRTMTNHVKTHDKSSQSDPCPDCGKILASTDSLRQHIKMVHKKDL